MISGILLADCFDQLRLLFRSYVKRKHDVARRRLRWLVGLRQKMAALDKQVRQIGTRRHSHWLAASWACQGQKRDYLRTMEGCQRLDLCQYMGNNEECHSFSRIVIALVSPSGRTTRFSTKQMCSTLRQLLKQQSYWCLQVQTYLYYDGMIVIFSMLSDWRCLEELQISGQLTRTCICGSYNWKVTAAWSIQRTWRWLLVATLVYDAQRWRNFLSQCRVNYE